MGEPLPGLRGGRVVSEGAGGMPIEDEFALAEREAAVEEVRMKRGLSVDELLDSYVRHCEVARRIAADARARAGVEPSAPARRESECARLAMLFHGPDAPAR